MSYGVKRRNLAADSDFVWHINGPEARSTTVGDFIRDRELNLRVSVAAAGVSRFHRCFQHSVGRMNQYVPLSISCKKQCNVNRRYTPYVPQSSYTPSIPQS
ncbi:PREDICTED: uncharacterized protein LOC105563785 [Vollenhovia emeryi]|uniref:uncharacterized protein LOC105563785 n=1 Tax=Vollenhovia emeryi TaxID=411798 RepID=UPI0005F4762C|nr:PREDICTED: uncharacterized protein LOC105563785 [Vollenhovia emeryi]